MGERPLMLRRVVGLMVLVLCCGAFLLWWYLRLHEPFDAQRWRSEPDSWKYMSSSLVESNLLIGMNRGEVLDALGSQCKYCTDDSDNWMYYLDITSGLPNYKVEGISIIFQNDTVVSVNQW
jgi:hypothetical protein